MLDAWRIISAFLAIGAGAMLIFNEAYVRESLLTSWQGRLWRRLLGDERAIFVLRRIFGPLFMMIGVAGLAFNLTRLLTPR